MYIQDNVGASECLGLYICRGYNTDPVCVFFYIICFLLSGHYRDRQFATHWRDSLSLIHFHLEDLGEVEGAEFAGGEGQVGQCAFVFHIVCHAGHCHLEGGCVVRIDEDMVGLCIKFCTTV